MSVKELRFKTGTGNGITIRHIKDEFEFEIDLNFWLNRNQAHLLMLYLKEHLKK